MSLPQNCDVLKNELEDITYAHLCNYINTCTVHKQQTLLSCLSMYIHLLNTPLNNGDSSGLYTALMKIRIHLCTRLLFDSANSTICISLTSSIFFRVLTILVRAFYPQPI